MTALASCPECGTILDDPADHSDPARRRYFAILREAWMTLPDNWLALCPTSEHLRKYCLIKVGHCDTSIVNCGSSKAAVEVAAMAKRLDTYSVTTIRGAIVTVYIARSQRKRVQPKKQFMECSEKVYGVLAEILGTDPAELLGRAA
jgi:hypothetical protein